MALLELLAWSRRFPLMAASATFALKAGEWFRRGRLLIVSPILAGHSVPAVRQNSTYRPVQIFEAGSEEYMGAAVVAH